MRFTPNPMPWVTDPAGRTGRLAFVAIACGLAAVSWALGLALITSWLPVLDTARLAAAATAGLIIIWLNGALHARRHRDAGLPLPGLVVMQVATLAVSSMALWMLAKAIQAAGDSDSRAYTVLFAVGLEALLAPLWFVHSVWVGVLPSRKVRPASRSA